jgi:hypothetical protein
LKLKPKYDIIITDKNKENQILKEKNYDKK